MATVEEPRTFIRPDGKEKVTGSGRYTADLVLAGQLIAKFRYADHTHARINRIDASKARALPGVLAVVTHEDVPDVLYGGMGWFSTCTDVEGNEFGLWQNDTSASM